MRQSAVPGKISLLVRLFPHRLVIRFFFTVGRRMPPFQDHQIRADQSPNLVNSNAFISERNGK